MASWETIAQKIRVPIGRLGVVLLLFMRPTWRSLVLGGIVAGAGASIRLWAAGCIDKGKALATQGPYSMTRNPLYFGSLILGFGIFIGGQLYWMLLPFGIVFLALYYPVMKREEQELYQGYGTDFTAYASRVPRFFPRFPSAAVRSSAFLWSRVKRNREHRHLLVLVLFELFLIIRIYW